MFRGGKPAERYIPGRVPGAPKPAGGEDKKKRVRTKRTGKQKDEESGETNGDAVESAVPVEEMASLEVAMEDEATQKKMRNLMKKVSPVL